MDETSQNEEKKSYYPDAENSENKEFFHEAELQLKATEEVVKATQAEIEKLEKEIEEAKKIMESGEDGTVIDLVWAHEHIDEYKFINEVAKIKKDKIEVIIQSKTVGTLPKPIEFEPKFPEYKKLEAANGNPVEEEKSKEDKKKTIEQQEPPYFPPTASNESASRIREAAIIRNLRNGLSGTEKIVSAAQSENKLGFVGSKANFKKQEKQEKQERQSSTIELAAKKNSVKKVAKKGKKKQTKIRFATENKSIAAPVNAKQKEVARGVSSSVLASQQERQEGVQTKTEKVKPSLGLSPQAKKELMKEERRQEKVFKKLAEENDKGITAERTIKSKEKQQEEKITEKQRQTGEVKKAADQLRHAEMAKKIDQLREKLNDLHQKRNEHMISLGKSASEQVVKMTPEQVKELPSMKAEAAMNKAEASLDLPKAERGGAISEASLRNMEKTTEKAESGLKQATLVPDYATKEFKQKAEEQGIPLTQTGAQVEKESVKNQKALDRQKIMALSGRVPEAVSNEQSSHGQQNQNETENQTEQQNEKQQLRIDPEKSREMSAEKNGKQISMQKYQAMKQVRGGRAAG